MVSCSENCAALLVVTADLTSWIRSWALGSNQVSSLLLQIVDIAVFGHHIFALFQVEARSLGLLHDHLELF